MWGRTNIGKRKSEQTGSCRNLQEKKKQTRKTRGTKTYQRVEKTEESIFQQQKQDKMNNDKADFN